MLSKNKSAAAVRVITVALREEGEAEEKGFVGKVGLFIQQIPA